MKWGDICLGCGHKIQDHSSGKRTSCNKQYCSCHEFKVTLLQEEL